MNSLLTTLLTRWLSLGFAPGLRHSMDGLGFDSIRTDRKALQVLQPGFPADYPPPEPSSPRPPGPKDVPAPAPRDVPVPEPVDVPPPEPQDVPPPEPKPRKQTPAATRRGNFLR